MKGSTGVASGAKLPAARPSGSSLGPVTARLSARQARGATDHTGRARSLLPRSDGGVGAEGAAGGLLLVPDNVHDRVDQRQVGERLREVAEVAAGARVDLLAVEQQRAGVGQHLLAQVTRPLVLADLSQR